ncbi:MAG: efflux RND transporter periplasmic adaptor subunit [Myxococcota bacterium]
MRTRCGLFSACGLRLRASAWVLALVACGVSGCGEEAAPKSKGERVVPVEVAPIRVGAIERKRTFSGSLDAFAQFDLAPKIAGRVATVAVDIGDTVAQGSVVVTLDDEQARKAVALAEAKLAVARAGVAGASSTLGGARRDLGRERTLHTGGISSDSQLDAAKTREGVAGAAAQVARAQVAEAEAQLAVAQLELEETQIRARWSEGDDARTVAARVVDPGDTVAANTPLLTIVELDPLVAVISVTERDYPLLSVGQTASLVTDAAPGETFAATISRIAPAFSAASRQARVELHVDNSSHHLKPGAFARITISLARADGATIVPEAALSRRKEQDGLFTVNADGTVTWRVVTVGIRDGVEVQVEGEGLTGQVVVLGQQLLDDGTRVSLPAPAHTEPAGG